MLLAHHHYFDAYHSAPINIGVPSVVDDSTLTLSWSTPQSVMVQGVEQYVIDVAQRCMTEENAVNPQQFVITPIQRSNVTVTNLRKLHS